MVTVKEMASNAAATAHHFVECIDVPFRQSGDPRMKAYSVHGHPRGLLRELSIAQKLSRELTWPTTHIVDNGAILLVHQVNVSHWRRRLPAIVSGESGPLSPGRGGDFAEHRRKPLIIS
jgi:hypothetical protein